MGDTLHVYTRDDYLPFKTVVVAYTESNADYMNDTVGSNVGQFPLDYDYTFQA